MWEPVPIWQILTTIVVFWLLYAALFTAVEYLVDGLDFAARKVLAVARAAWREEPIQPVRIADPAWSSSMHETIFTPVARRH